MTHPYNTPEFAACFDGLADLENIGEGLGYIRLREIEGTPYKDAITAAPRHSFSDAEALAQALRGQNIISATIIPDPLQDTQNIEENFDTVRPFKTHYVYDPSLPLEFHGFHKTNIAIADKKCTVRRIALHDHLNRCMALWETLVERHHIEGLGRFSRSYFERLALVPGLIAYGAFDEGGALVAISLWFEHGDHAVSHLNACAPEGYKIQANYGIYKFMLDDLKDKTLIDLGSNVGMRDDPEDGLSKFKAGFSNATRQSYVCGLICDRVVYEELSAGSGDETFFPAYRAPKEES